MYHRRLSVLLLLLALLTTRLPAQQDPACFALHGLPDSLHPLAHDILQHFADGEGLYTLGGGLKPVSSGYRTLTYRTLPQPDQPRLDTLDRWRSVVPHLRCANLEVVVQQYLAPHPSFAADEVVRAATLVLVHRGALQREIKRHAAFWAALGITPSSSAETVLMAVDAAARDFRWRGYGYLFGYPTPAIDFFVEAGLTGDSLGVVVPRDFRRIETWRKFPAAEGEPPTLSSFVYAVAKDAPETAQDRMLRDRAAPIYQEYRQLRPTTPAGILAALRGWARVYEP